MTTFSHKKYPEIAKYFRTEFPKVRTAKPKVFEQFMNYAVFSKADDAEQVLKTGWNPTISVLRIPGKYGNTPTTGDSIQLDSRFLDDVEAIFGYHYAPSIYEYYQIRDRTQLLLEITTLHELVHWCRQKLYGVNPNRKKAEAIAQDFEIQAYGQVHSAKSLHVDAWIR